MCSIVYTLTAWLMESKSCIIFMNLILITKFMLTKTLGWAINVLYSSKAPVYTSMYTQHILTDLQVSLSFTSLAFHHSFRLIREGKYRHKHKYPLSSTPPVCMQLIGWYSWSWLCPLASCSKHHSPGPFHTTCVSVSVQAVKRDQSSPICVGWYSFPAMYLLWQGAANCDMSMHQLAGCAT